MPTGPQSSHLAARNADIVRRRSAGESLQAIGARFGVSRERVRQIVRDGGGPQGQLTEAVKRRREREVAEPRARELVALWSSGREVSELARGLGLSTRAVGRVIDAAATEAERHMHLTQRMRRYSDADLIKALLTVADQLGRTPYSVDYKRAAEGTALPGYNTLLRRFGSWPQAAGAAGLPPPANRRAPAKRTRPRKPRRRPGLVEGELRALAERFPEPPVVGTYRL